MEPIVELHGSKTARVVFASLAWLFGILVLLTTLVWALNHEDAPSSETMLVGIGALLLLFFVWLNRWDDTYCNVSLQGRRLSFGRGRMRKKFWEIDTRQVTALYGDTDFENMIFKTPYRLHFIMQDGSWVVLTLKWVSDAEKKLLYPLFSELVNRPSIKLYGRINQISRSWFGAQAPMITREIERGMPRSK